MNKPLVAAISGVAFGATLMGAIVFTQSRTRSRHCPHRSFIVQRTVIEPARPLPQSSLSAPEDETPVSLCPRLVLQPHENADQQLTYAQTEYVNGNYSCAASLAEKVATKNPVRAYRIIGAAACRNQDLPSIKQSFRHLDAPGRQYMVYVCQRSGVAFGKHGPVIAE